MAAQAAQAGMSIVGDVAQYGTTTNATNTAQQSQEAFLNKGISGMLGLQQQNTQAWSPYQQMGTNALQNLQSGNLQMDPGMQFAMTQGTNVMNQQAGARGHYFAPQTMEALTAYGQNVGNEFYQQAFQNQMAQVGVGQQATGQQTNQAFSIQNMLNNLYQGVGNVQAQGAMGGAAAQNQLIGGIQGSLSGGGMSSMISPSSFNAGGGGSMTPSMSGGGK